MRNTILLVLGCVALLAAGCATPSAYNVSDKRKGIARLNLTKQGAMACILYADAHGGQYPPDLPATVSYFSNPNTLLQLEAEYDLVYSGVADKVTTPWAAIILKEKQAWQTRSGSWVKTYAFADGHCEVHKAEGGRFDEWEKGRIIQP